MNRYWVYLKYVMKHKWYVFKGSRMVDPWNLHLFYRAVIHDLSKLSPGEFVAYAKTFYAPDGSGQYDETLAFSYAWNHHQKCNKHHWQYWILKYDRGDSEELEMPEIYFKEMMADWIGAGWAITGDKYNTIEFYRKNNTGRFLHPTTMAATDSFIEKLKEMKAAEEQRIRIWWY